MNRSPSTPKTSHEQLNNFPEHEIQNWNSLFDLKPANQWLEDADHYLRVARRTITEF